MDDKAFLAYLLQQKALTSEYVERCIKVAQETQQSYFDILLQAKILPIELLTNLHSSFENLENTEIQEESLPEEKTSLTKNELPSHHDELELFDELLALAKKEKAPPPKKNSTQLHTTNEEDEDSFLSHLSFPSFSIEERYQVLETLGEGGMGVVQKVYDQRLAREVALKKIRFSKKKKLTKKQQLLLWRLKKEASITAILEHPNIVPLYDIQEEKNGDLFFTMRKIEGDTLRTLLLKIREGKDEKSKLLTIFLKTCDAIAYAHNQGVIHRDLKPDNIMLGPFGEVYVMDWGIAKVCHEKEEPFNLEKDEAPSTHVTPYNTIGGLGTEGYMAPEQRENAVAVTTSADIFSLGVLLRECFTLYSPMEELKQEIESNKLKRQKKRNKLLPKDILAIVNKATELESEKRYSSVQELAEDVERYLKHIQVLARDYHLFEQVLKWTERNWKGVLFTAIIIFLCTIVGVGVTLWHRETTLKAQFKVKIAEEKEKYQFWTSLVQNMILNASYELKKGNVERAALLARQAYLFNKRKNLNVYNSLDEALRKISSTPYPCNILSGHKYFVCSIAFSSNQKWMATGGLDGKVYLWNFAKKEGTPKILSPHSNSSKPIFSLDFHPKENKLVVANGTKEIQIWNLDQLEIPPLRLTSPQISILSVSFSPDGKYLLSGSGALRILKEKSKRFEVRLWNLSETQVRSTSLYSHEHVVTSVAFSLDEKWVASGSWDGNIIVYNFASKETLILKGHLKEISKIQFDPKSKILISGGFDGTVRIWDFRTPSRKPIILAGHSAKINSIFLETKQGRYLASGSEDRTIRIWDLKNIKATPVVIPAYSQVGSVAFSPDGEYLAAGALNTIRIWQPFKQEEVVASNTFFQQEFANFRMKSSSNGKYLALSGYHRAIWLWEKENLTHQPIGLVGKYNGTLGLDFSADEKWLAGSGFETSLQLWNLNSKELLLLKGGHSDMVTDVAFSPSGKQLLSCGKDGQILLWKDFSSPSFEVFTTIEALKIKGGMLLFHPDKKHFVVGAGKKILVFNFKTKELLKSVFLGHEDHILALAIQNSPNPYLASVGLDGKVLLWKNFTGENSVTPMILQEIEGHFSAVAFSPDGKKIAAGSSNGLIRIWNLEDLKANPVLIEATKLEVTGIVFSQDSKRLFSTGKEGTAQSWIIDGEELVDLVCVRVWRNLTWKEWKQFIGKKIPYEKTCPEYPEHYTVSEFKRLEELTIK